MDHVEVIFPSKSGLAEIASSILILGGDSWGGIKSHITDSNRHY